MKNMLMLSLCLLLAYTSQAQNHSLHLLKSEVQWTGKAAFNAYALSGTIQLKSGTFKMEGENISAATMVMDMPTLSSEMDQLTHHLKSADFFEVNKYPEATFVLSEIIVLKVGAQVATGLLTIKETVLPIGIPLDITREGEQWIIKGQTMIDRTAYGIKFNSPSYFEKLKDQAIADEFELRFELVLAEGIAN
ncbi:MAG: YceI family protein [Saprospiraceae bacterium]